METGISQPVINRLLRKHKFHPYPLHVVQSLRDADFQMRINFCNWLLNELRNVPNLLQLLFFTDESTFNSNGILNIHNEHYYAVKNSHIIRPLIPKEGGV